MNDIDLVRGACYFSLLFLVSSYQYRTAISLSVDICDNKFAMIVN